MELTRPLAELTRADEPRFGGKSASLGELLAAGIPVPPGFALSAHAMDAPRMSDPVRDAVARGYAGLGDNVPVAVRSSAVGEDSAEATFAGMQQTYLWVRGLEQVCARVIDCWASLYSDTSVSYRAHLGDAAPEPAMGVAIQKMVDAEVAGVMFTCNPTTGDPSMLAINASWGLGLAVVGGEVTPDDILVSKVTGEIVRERLQDKGVEYVPGPGDTGTVCRDVDEDRRGARCLDDRAIAELLAVARRVERHFGSHQDIEFAIARDGGGLFVVQSRPVTTGPARKKPPAPPADAMSLVMQTFGAGKPRGAH